MMKSLWIIPFLGIPVGAQAQIGEQIVDQIQQANKIKMVGEVADPGCENCFPKLAQECRKAICESRGYEDRAKDEAKLIADSKKVDVKEVQQQLNKLVEIPDTLEFTSSEKQKLKVALKSYGGEIPAELQGLSRLKALQLLLKGRQIPTAVTEDGVRVDADKMKRLFPDLSPQQQAAVISSFAAISRDEESKNYWSGVPRQAVMIEDMTYAQSLKAAIKDKKEERKKAPTVWQQLGLGLPASLMVIADLEKESPRTDESASMMLFDNSAEDMQIERLGKATEDSDAALAQIDLAPLRQQLKDPSLKQRLEKRIEQKASRPTTDDCIRKYQFTRQALPTAQQLQTAKELVKKAKATIKAKYGPKYSEKTRALIAKRLDEVGVRLPPSKEEFKKRFLAAINREMRIRRESRAFREKNFQAEKVTALLALNEVAPSDLLQEIGTGVGPDRGLGFCDRFEYIRNSGMNGLFDGIEMELFLGRDVARGGPYAEGIIFHELGHVLDSVFIRGDVSSESLKKRDEQKQCLAAKLKDSQSESMMEDFADIIGAENVKINYACDFVFGQGAAKSNILMSAETISEDENQTQIHREVHSSDFFRLLHIEQIQKGKLPKECNQFLVENKTPIDFSSCIK